MEELRAVTFRFGGEYEVRYLQRVPEVGDHVTHAGSPWLVASIDEDATGPIIRCNLPNGGSNGPPALPS